MEWGMQQTTGNQPTVGSSKLIDRVRLSGQEATVLPHLTAGLGNFEREGLDVTLVSEINQPHDYMMQAALHQDELDASVHWFQHVLYGAANGLPVKAVMLLNDAPEVTVLVANRVKDQIKTAADLKGRNVAEGAAFATKSILTNYLATRAGLPLGSYTPVLAEFEGRREAVLQGLKDGKVDVMTFQEPMTSALRETGLTSTLFDMTNKASTVSVLGNPYPAQCLFVTPSYIEQHPEIVQRLVNAFVRTMRFVNSHSAQEIVDSVPPSYFEGKDRASEAARIRQKVGAFAKDYRFTPGGVGLVIDAIQSAPFDGSEEGEFRARARTAHFDIDALYTNHFVERAMTAIA
jgi:NitT/TauT family transport system substrate-binding protein